MLYQNLVYNLLPNGFWSIVPAMPRGASAPVMRPEVGKPEIIPDITFIARPLTNADGISEAALHNRYNKEALTFHTTYGPVPDTANSFEYIVNHFSSLSDKIGRIRFVSHGNNKFLLFPFFNNGSWELGMGENYLKAMAVSDEAALRCVFTRNPASPSPVVLDGSIMLHGGLYGLEPTAVAPIGWPTPRGEAAKFLDIVNDFYQVQYGTLVYNNDLLNDSQKDILNTALSRIETEIRKRIIGITTQQLGEFKRKALARTPIELGFMGDVENLNANVITQISDALTKNEDAIRAAFNRRGREPLFWDNVNNMIDGLSFFKPAALKLGGRKRNAAFVTGNANLKSLAFVGSDLNFLKNGRITINNARPTTEETIVLRKGLMALAAIIKGRILSTLGNTITERQLDGLLAAMEDMTMQQSGITGGVKEFQDYQFIELDAACKAMQANFRDKLNHFKGLMKPSGESRFDIRGCMVGESQAYLRLMCDFLGTDANKPTITAPWWWQSFPLSEREIIGTSSAMNTLVARGLPNSKISPEDVSRSFHKWTDMISFKPHFSFISDLFGPATSKRDFVRLDWRVWRTGSATTGIPILGMEAKFMDDLISLTLSELIVRFQKIFDVAAGSMPDPAVLTKLDRLPSLLVTFKTKGDAVGAGLAPADLPQMFTDLTRLAGSIAPITGATLAALAPASNSLLHIQASVRNIGTNVDAFLSGTLNRFFTAVQGSLALPNPEIRYWYSIGLPLLLQSSEDQKIFAITYLTPSVTTNEGKDIRAAAMRSWMRVVWKGTPAQKTAMNTRIESMNLTTDDELKKAAQVSMLSHGDPHANLTVNAEICPMDGYDLHMASEPIKRN